MTPAVVVFAVLALTRADAAGGGPPSALASAGRPSFVGWFGPRGLASIVFTVLIVDEGAERTPLLTIDRHRGCVLAHGVTAPATGRYGAWSRMPLAAAVDR
jgi:hypothetical protein